MKPLLNILGKLLLLTLFSLTLGMNLAESSAIALILTAYPFLVRRLFKESHSHSSYWVIFSLNFYRYIFGLIWDMFCAGMSVAKLAMSPNLHKKLLPEVIDSGDLVKGSNDFQNILASISITLTPGSLTIDKYGDLLKIHRIQEGFFDAASEKSLKNNINKMV